MRWTGTLVLLVGCNWVSDSAYELSLDADGDGIGLELDCDPNDPSVGAPFNVFRDADDDGFGDPQDAVEVCAADERPGYVLDNTDCEDNNASIHPSAPEICNDVDDNCDTLTDDADPLLADPDLPVWVLDADGDGYRGPAQSDTVASSCERPEGYGALADDEDCNDEDGLVNPAAIEQCNGIDDDCDDEVDESGPNQREFYPDADGDGWAEDLVATQACNEPTSGFVLRTDHEATASSAGYPATTVDCDGNNPLTYPGAPETFYDGVDSDCGLDSDFDQDGDGEDRAVEGGTDCNDADPSINSVAVEQCNGVDDDCDGLTDEPGAVSGTETAVIGYIDQDFDGQPAEPTLPTLTVCPSALPPGYLTSPGPSGWDCDDTDPLVNALAVDVPGDGVDQNCSGTDARTCYEDTDLDGVGGRVLVIEDSADCLIGVETKTDCDDRDDSIFPGAPERCDGIDQNCDSVLEPVASGTRSDGTWDELLVGTTPDLSQYASVELCGGSWNFPLDHTNVLDLDVSTPTGNTTARWGLGAESIRLEQPDRLQIRDIDLVIQGSASLTEPVFVVEGALTMDNIDLSGAVLSPSASVLFSVDSDGSLVLDDVIADVMTPTVVAATGGTIGMDRTIIRGAGGQLVVASDSTITSTELDMVGLGATLSGESNWTWTDGSMTGSPAPITAVDSLIVFQDITFSGNTQGVIQGSPDTIGILSNCLVEANDSLGPEPVVSLGNPSVVTSTRFWGNDAGTQHVLWLEGGLIEQSEFVDNDGGAARLSGTGTVRSTVFTDNERSNGDGGALQVNGGWVVDDSEFDNNSALSGGALALTDGATVQGGSLFTGNQAVSAGGAIFVASGTVSIEDSTLSLNSARNGGAIGVEGGNQAVQLRLEDIDSSSNEAMLDGGGLWFSVDPSACPSSSLLVQNTTFDGDMAGQHGGGLALLSGSGCELSLTTENVILEGGTADGNGGGGYLQGPIEWSATDLQLAGNVAENVGGGLALTDVDVTSRCNTTCSMVDNEADVGGGLFIENSTWNMAPTSPEGWDYLRNLASESGAMRVESATTMNFGAARVLYSENEAQTASALTLEDSLLSFQVVQFDSNLAQTGLAIEIYGSGEMSFPAMAGAQTRVLTGTSGLTYLLAGYEMCDALLCD